MLLHVRLEDNLEPGKRASDGRRRIQKGSLHPVHHPSVAFYSGSINLSVCERE